MMQLALKMSLFLTSLTFGLGIICYLFDRAFSQSALQKDQFVGELTELFYIGFLKTFALCFFTAVVAIPVSAAFVAYKSLGDWLSAADEITLFAFGLAAWFTITGVYTVIATFRRTTTSRLNYIHITPGDAPDLFAQNEELARQFKVAPVKIIRLTPDSQVAIIEEINRLDDIYYGGKKRWEIGLAALQYLSVVDLKILMAAEYARYTPNQPKPIMFANRLNQRLSDMSENLARAGFFGVFNPVGWLIALANYSIGSIVSGALETGEIRAKNEVARFYGEKPYFQAFTRNNIESTVYREIISAADGRRRPGTPELTNIYQHIRSDRRFAALSRLAAENLVKTENKRSGKQSIMLKRLPEIAYMEPLIEQPAFNYLANREDTERRMMNLINYGQ
jgi:hypothetical protein